MTSHERHLTNVKRRTREQCYQQDTVQHAASFFVEHKLLDFSDTEFITLFITLQRKPFFIKPVHSIFLYRIISGYTYP